MFHRLARLIRKRQKFWFVPQTAKEEYQHPRGQNKSRELRYFDPYTA